MQRGCETTLEQIQNYCSKVEKRNYIVSLIVEEVGSAHDLLNVHFLQQGTVSIFMFLQHAGAHSQCVMDRDIDIENSLQIRDQI